jgi:hypothetical protein
VRKPSRLALAVLLVAAGRLLSPDAVPVYDGIGQPDEPYRYVVPPVGSKRTAAPTSAHATSPLVGGRSSYGMSVTTSESGPQFSLFLPPQAISTTGTTVQLKADPVAPTDQPKGARIDGNVYEVTFVAAGPVTLTDKAALATLYLRATTAKQPGPVMQHKASAGVPWEPVKTLRGGQDVYVSSFPGPGFYALAFAQTPSRKGSSSSSLPYLVLGGLLLVAVVVVVVRLRAAK